MAAQHMMGLKSVSMASAATKLWMNVGERKKSSEGTGGEGALVSQVPSISAEPASAMNILVGGIAPPPPGVCRGDLVPPPKRWRRPLQPHISWLPIRRGMTRARPGPTRCRCLATRKAPAGSPRWRRPSTQLDSHHLRSRCTRACPSGSAHPARVSRRSGSPRSSQASECTSCSDACASSAM
jgi:hypothetical protein